MVAIINGEEEIVIPEPYLIIEKQRLYNTKTKQYEGIDGDIVSFTHKNTNLSGMVEGYTHGAYVKIRGVEKPFIDAEKKEITHISTIEEKIV